MAAVVILAAGQGTRMKSSTAKVLHRIGGRSLLGHAIAAGKFLNPTHLAVVVRHERDQVAAEARALHPPAVIADQDDVPGTGRAAQCALIALDEVVSTNVTGPIAVISGDVPLLDGQTLAWLLDAHRAEGNAVTLLTTMLDDATGYGRVVRAADDSVTAIVEHRDASDAQREIREINSGTYIFDAAILRAGLSAATRDNNQGEMYLTDVIAHARAAGLRVGAVVTEDQMLVAGVNDRVQLAALGRELNRRIVKEWMRAGVTVVDPATTWIDVDVDLEADATLLPGTQLHGATSIAAGAIIGPDTTLTDTEVGAGAAVTRTQALLAVIGEGATVGPFTYLRPGTTLGAGGKIGGFVEVKNAQIDAGAKVPHLSYVGDATIGEGANLGAGTIVANYDGVKKHRTHVGVQARVGSDNVLVAPVTIGDGAYTAAGSVITEDVAPGALGIGRARQTQLPDWVAKNRADTEAASAATAQKGATGGQAAIPGTSVDSAANPSED